MQLRYSIYQQEVSLPSYLDNCNNLAGQRVSVQSVAGVRQYRGRSGDIARPSRRSIPLEPACGVTPTAKPRCRCARNWLRGSTLTSAVGYTLDYNTLDNNKNPTDGLLIDWKQDFAGVGGDVTYLKSAVGCEVLHAAGG